MCVIIKALNQALKQVRGDLVEATQSAIKVTTTVSTSMVHITMS